ncbi:4-alpha-glucanotransferase [Tepiditoga spiralis]|uniref:Alpha-amylase n=1 Tax=Tepiditoga spiralis TaxID=2108365 RepID=A0A7G1G309_9BACT|nr:alpha-amylase family glycosyl hydrolase [Tepiditoga spiralis]BBE30768.1 4-alpha-glucanotransferase [Tepiditoga spiralis]
MIFYELYLRSFFDGNGDGIGDFSGLNKKLDYFVNLGITHIWLLPIMKSPSFHGYTITDFYNTNPLYGNLEELKETLKNGHNKGLKFVLDIPVNHVSINHPWFQKALNGDKKYENYFIWSNDKTDINEKRHWGNNINIWHKVNDKYFYGLFGPGSPELNFENKNLWNEMKKIFSFWLEIGFDGFRLDAAKHIFDYNIKEMKFEYQHEKNISFWKEMISHIKSINPNSTIISEVWDDPKIVKKYNGIFEIGFNFPFSYDLKESLKRNSTKKFINGLKNSMENYLNEEKIITNSGNFLTNHDMTRLMSELKTIEKVKFSIAMLMTLPGNPFIYYGEELGMKGKLSNVDFTEDAEEPLQWYSCGYGIGQTEWKNIKFNKPYSGVSFEEQINNETSILNFLKSVIAFRKENDWISEAKIKILYSNKNMVKLSVFNRLNEFIIYYNFKSHEIKLDNFDTSKIIKIFGNFNKKNKSLEKYSILVLKGR